MIALEGAALEFHFPEVNDAVCQIEFQRTLRIPDDGREYPLTAGLGSFPLYHLEDYEQAVPEDWRRRGGVFFPMYQAEAMWIRFGTEYPCAVMIASGKINAVSGDTWQNRLAAHPQNYLVVPGQKWLDGFCVEQGLIRQFVAVPLGIGATAEEQVTGKGEFGGLQIGVCPMRIDAYEAWRRKLLEVDRPRFCRMESLDYTSPGMGLAPGGLMRQELYLDSHGVDVWDVGAMERVFVHLVNSEQFLSITGQKPPRSPITLAQYEAAGILWFEYYDNDKQVLAGSSVLGKLQGLAKWMPDLGKSAGKRRGVRVARQAGGERVSDGDW